VNKRKNIENLLQALPLINDKFIPLVIVGKEDWKQVDYTSFVENGGVRERILFTGWTDDEDLPVIYSLATVFCFPSFAEGFGLPPLEAMASGVPVVTSNVTSLPEICGKAVLYVSPENPSEMANAVNNLLENKSFYQLKVSEGIEHAREFTWEQAAKKFSLTFSK
jgi:glycosyltransferase involved in cell wall biosynthesis